VKEIVDNSDEVVLGGKRQPVTILFSDIRGFTPLSERMTPEQVVSLLNEYFDKMTDVIFQSGGTIDKFVGDCIMALWGAPIPKPGDAARAVRAAVLMRQALAELQEKWRQQGREPFETGIGINSADVVVGNIGSHKRLDYTVIGDGVNLAARLESATKELGASLVISEATYALVCKQVIARPLEPILVKGKEHPVTTYEVIGWREEDGTILFVPGAASPDIEAVL
jgi:adenylate cyclase